MVTEGEHYKHARRLFHALCDLDDAEQRRRLALESPPAEVLKHLDSLLEIDLSSGPLEMESPALIGLKLLEENGVSQPTRLGPYEVLGVLGEGGMGVVYEARREGSNESVALKVLRASFGASSAARRFQREASVLKKLDHIGIAKFHETGRISTDAPGSADVLYLAMEHIAGDQIINFSRKRKLGIEARVKLLARVCDAVEYAHQAGVIHRDLKPGNVLVVDSDDGVGQPKVLDFGIARLSGMDVDTMTVTESGMFLGTVPYMSPEQVGGGARELDERSDIYALGVMAYELLGERLPYDVKNCALPRAARIIQEVEPTNLGQLSPLLHGPIEVIVQRSLEKEPDHRYSSVASFAADLRASLTGDPITARAPSIRRQFTKFTRRHRALTIGVTGSFLALLFAIVGISKFALGEQRAHRQALHEGYKASISLAASSIEHGEVVIARNILEQAPQEFRSWEWSNLVSRLDTSVALLEVPAQPFENSCNLGVDASGSVYLTGGFNGEPKFSSYRWDYRTGASEHIRAPGGGGVVDARARWLVVSKRRGFRLKSLVSASEPHDYDGARLPFAFALGGLPKRIAYRAGSEIWYLDFADGQPVLVPDLKSDAHLDQGTNRLIGRTGSMLIVVDLLSGERLDEVDIGTSSGILAQSPAGDRLALISKQAEQIRLWEVSASGQLREGPTLVGHDSAVFSLAFNASGTRLASGSEDSTVRLWDTRTGKPEGLLLGHTGTVRCLGFDPSGETLISYAARSGKGELRAWQVGAGSGQRFQFGSPVLSVALLEDGQSQIVGGVGGAKRLNAGCVEPVKLVECDGEILAAVAPPDGSWYACHINPKGDKNRRHILVVNGTTGDRIAELASDSNWPSMALAPKRGLLVVQSNDLAISVWNTTSWELVASLPPMVAERQGRVAVAWSEDETTLAVTGTDGTVRLLDGNTLDQECVLHGPSSSVDELAFSPDARQLVAVDRKEGMRIWDLTRASTPARVLDHTRGLRTIAWSRDGLRLITGGTDRLLSTWDPVTGDKLVQFRGHTKGLVEIRVAKDGSGVITGSIDGTTLRWPTKATLPGSD